MSTRSELRTALGLLSKSALSFEELDYTDPVRGGVDPDCGVSDLGLELPTQGRGLDAVIAAVDRVLAATPATSGPRFYNQLFAGRDPAASFADMMASLANNSMYTYKVAGPMVLIENLLLSKMAALAGMNGAEGAFAPGGSTSNLLGLLCARNHAAPRARDEGLDGRRLRVYTSADSHYSIRKAVGILGLGRHNLVSVRCDDEGRMVPAALAQAIDEDLRAGAVPVAVNATSGTTVQGAFDPVDAIADVTEPRGVWLHVDGAFGGSMLLSTKRRHLLAGLERADSFTWDAHKMMGVPLTCSVILVKHSGALTAALHETASYLYQGDVDLLNPGKRSIQCGRRNDALKLWAAWHYHGDRGWEDRVERQVRLAQTLAARVDTDDDFHLVRSPQGINVCFELKGHDSASICTALNRRQLAMVGHGNVAGRSVIRAACINPALTEDDLERLVGDIKEVSRSV